MRNGVVLAEPAAVPLPEHVVLEPAELADFVLGLAAPGPGTALATLGAALDRSAFVFLPDSPANALDDHLGEGSQ